MRFTGLGQPLYLIPPRFWEGIIPCMLVDMDSPWWWDGDRHFYVWHMGSGSDMYVPVRDLFTTREAAQEEIQIRLHQRQLDFFTRLANLDGGESISWGSLQRSLT